VIKYSTAAEAIALIEQAGINLLDGEARTPLIHSAISGKMEILSWLLANGADIDHQDRDGRTALHYAVSVKRVDMVTELLERGADVHLSDVHGNAPLWRAVFDAKGKYDLVELLLSHKANPNSKNRSNASPLDFAHRIGDDRLASLLSGEDLK
jgi:ankyrin repeat protein